MKFGIHLLVFYMLCCSSSVKAIEVDKITVDLGEQLKFKSDILTEDRQLYVHLPQSYSEGNSPYPVIFLLDGNRHFQHAVSAVGYLADEGLIEPHIVVAIPNVGDSRLRDFAHQKEAFTRFLVQEVTQIVDEKYRTTEHRTLFGHSLGGAFSLYSASVLPDFFDYVIAASPVISGSNETLFKHYDQLLSSKEEVKLRLFLTSTDTEAEISGSVQVLDRFIQLLELKAHFGLRWRYQFLSDQTHMTTPYLTLFDGLIWASKADSSVKE